MTILYSAIILTLSLLGSFGVIYRKVFLLRTRSSFDTYRQDVIDNSFVFNFGYTLSDKAASLFNFIVEYFFDNIKPHVDNLVDSSAELMHLVSARMARKFIQFSNFIQGKRVLKNRGTTSLFIRDMATYADKPKRGRPRKIQF